MSKVYLLTAFNFNRYRKKVSLYNERVGDLNTVTQQRDDIKKQYDEWRKKRHDLLYLCLYLYLYMFCSFPSYYFYSNSTVIFLILGWTSSWQDSMLYL